MKNDLKESLYFLRNYVGRQVSESLSYTGLSVSIAVDLIEKLQHAIDHVGNDHCEDYEPPED